MNLRPADLLKRVHVADGGWASILAQRGLPPGGLAEEANLTQPELVRSLARDYAAAGARFISTNTFAANSLMLAARGCPQDVVAINRRGAELAREGGAGHNVLIVGVLGPSGRLLAVRETTQEKLAAAFAAQAKALAAGGADLLALETFSDLLELLTAVRAVKEATRLPVIASLSFDSGPQRTRTIMGVEAGEAAATLDEAGADLIGSNCGAGVGQALPAVVALRAGTRKPLWVRPSAGLPDLVDGRPVYPQTPEDFTEPVPQLLEAGANVIGGCCGVGPEHIQRLAAIVASRQRKKPPASGGTREQPA